jgi:hypothetical protein
VYNHGKRNFVGERVQKMPNMQEGQSKFHKKENAAYFC